MKTTMTAAPYKFDDGHSYSAQCFPTRTFLARRKEGAGHWLAAYRKAEEDKYRTVRRRMKETYNKQKNNRSTAPDACGGRALDRALLLQLHCVEKPSELCSVDISDQQLDSVRAEEIKVFDNVAYIDASVNFLSLGSFSGFAALRELNLSLNRLRSVTFDAADFPHLEVLDLSFNSLSGDDIVSIGRLSCLRVLHLTGNQLHRLPPNLGSSNRDPDQTPPKEEGARFKALEVLVLDDNRLSSGVFNSLANLKRLKYLNLQRNRITEIPFLQSKDSLRTSTEEQTKEEALTEPNPNADDGEAKRIAQVIHIENGENYRESSSPLPELQFLNVAGNKVVAEEALLAVAVFPMLREIDISSNPLTIKRSGDPPLLTYYLQDRLGITIKRKETQEVKAPLKVSTNPKWKVRETIPKVSKKLLVMDELCPALTHVDDGAGKKKTEPADRNDGDEGTQHFFVTQLDLRSQEKEMTENQERNEIFTHFKMSLDDQSELGAAEPIGIQTAVRMLEHALKNLNIYRDSKPKLDSIQTPCREQEKRIKPLPPLKPAKQLTERNAEKILEVKESTTIRGFPLSSVIRGKGENKHEYKEAVSPLEDMKTKYEMVCEKTTESGSEDGVREKHQPKHILTTPHSSGQ